MNQRDYIRVNGYAIGKTFGIGTIIAELLQRFGIKKRPGCGCQRRQAWLDRNTKEIAVFFFAVLWLAVAAVALILAAKQ